VKWKVYDSQRRGVARGVIVDPVDSALAVFNTSTGQLVRKYDALGTEVWTTTFTGSRPYDLAADADGSALVTGDLTGQMTVGGATISAMSADTKDTFVTKLGSQGAHQWTKTFKDTGDQTTVAIVVDASKNITLFGAFSGGIDLGGGTLTSAGGEDLFLAKLDPSGAYVWSASFGDVGTQLVGDVAAHPSGDVIITGTAVGGTISFGAGQMSAGPGHAPFVAKFPRP
jgi:hypothetical protein